MKQGQREAEEARRQKAYRSSDTDVAAARLLGLKLVTYRAWRMARGLPAKASVGRPLLTKGSRGN